MSVTDSAGPGPQTVPRHRDDALKSVANTLDVLDCFLTDDELQAPSLATTT